MITTSELKNSIISSSKTKTKKLLIQPRDYLILKFILEQKFASLEVIYFRFFDVRKNSSDPLPNHFWTTRQRLSKLRQACLIKTEKVLSSSRAHYLLTPLGYRTLLSHVEVLNIKPAKRIDFSLYEHDLRVSLIRAIAERKGAVKAWYSEKVIRGSVVPIVEGGFKFAKDLYPDAVFINSKGERVALEFEMSRKGLRRVENKVRDYERYLGSWRGGKVIDKVWIVSIRQNINNVYQRAIGSEAQDALNYRLDLFCDVIPQEAIP